MKGARGRAWASAALDAADPGNGGDQLSLLPGLGEAVSPADPGNGGLQMSMMPALEREGGPCRQCGAPRPQGFSATCGEPSCQERERRARAAARKR